LLQNTISLWRNKKKADEDIEKLSENGFRKTFPWIGLNGIVDDKGNETRAK
jgi:hypothetical protein